MGYTYRFSIPAVVEALKQEEIDEESDQITEQLELPFDEDADV